MRAAGASARLKMFNRIAPDGAFAHMLAEGMESARQRRVSSKPLRCEKSSIFRVCVYGRSCSADLFSCFRCRIKHLRSEAGTARIQQQGIPGTGFTLCRRQWHSRLALLVLAAEVTSRRGALGCRIMLAPFTTCAIAIIDVTGCRRSLFHFVGQCRLGESGKDGRYERLPVKAGMSHDVELASLATFQSAMFRCGTIACCGRRAPQGIGSRRSSTPRIDGPAMESSTRASPRWQAFPWRSGTEFSTINVRSARTQCIAADSLVTPRVP